MTVTATPLAASGRGLRPLYIAAILLGSFLLFLVQPLFGRLVLPVLGGSPQVWNTAMLFYQAMLLGGYVYADRLARLPLARQLTVHLGLFALAALTLPIGIAAWYPPAGAAAPLPWLIGLLAVSVGPVFFLVSAQAPLLQAWFARSSDPAAANPYFLYAASNLGSFAGLFAYPLLVEPLLGLGVQRWAWSAGFVALALVTGLAGLAAMRAGASTATAAVRGRQAGWAQRRRWALLAALPSALLLSTTTHLTTDIMAMPLLWVVPLGLYLLSFVIVFSGIGPGVTRAAVALAPALLLMAGSWACFQSGAGFGTGFAVAGVALLFVIAVALHGTLAMERPGPDQLTDFYVWMSLGGALGGLFCALIAPLLFDWPYEHPLLLIAAALLVPAPVLRPFRAMWQRWPTMAALAVAALAASWFSHLRLQGNFVGAGGHLAPLLFVVAGGIYLAAVTAIGRRWLFAALFAALILTLGGWQQLDRSWSGAHHRSFFGVYTVYEGSAERYLMHGTTLHGQQSLLGQYASVPMTYYAPESGVGLVFDAAPVLVGPHARIAFVGLGTGTLACYHRPGQDWTVFEIDPVVLALARSRFTYLSGCNPGIRVVLGDARLTLAAEPAARFDLLAVDAFSSDAIPLHLLTREAFRVYGRALAPDGVLLVHVSNRFLNLAPVLAAIARAEGWQAAIRSYRPVEPQPRGQRFTTSIWVALSRSPTRLRQVTALGAQPGQPAWHPLPERAGLAPWSDDFASVLPVVRQLEATGLYQ